MRAPKVRLYIRVRDEHGKSIFADPAWNRNKTLRAGHAVVDGHTAACADGVYYLRYLNNGKRTWMSVGGSPDAAITALRNTERELHARSLGLPTVRDSESVPVPAKTQLDTPSITTKDAVARYLSDVARFKSSATYKASKLMLGLLAEKFGHLQLCNLRRQDLLEHRAELEADGTKGPRTVYNHLTRITSFLRSEGITGLLANNDYPKYDEPEAEAFSSHELQALFAAAKPTERQLFEFFLKSGFRDQEVMFCTWKNIDFKGKVVTVRAKPDLGFRPKDHEERSVPVPDELIASLIDRKRESRSIFVFPGIGGRPNQHLLRVLKRVALRAGLNCGECLRKNRKKGTVKSCRDHAICGSWLLHKFRKTFATMHCEAGVTPHTIQRWLGHSDLATTLRYLAIADMRSERTRGQVNASFACLDRQSSAVESVAASSVKLDA